MMNYKEENESTSDNGREKSGRLLSPLSTALPPCGPCLGSPCSIGFAREFGKREALPNDVADGQIEAVSVSKWIVFRGSVIESKHLLIKVAKQMERFDTHVGSRDAALQQRPKVLKAIRVNAAINVLSRMVNYLVSILACQPIVGQERIGIEGRASSDVLAYFLLQHGLATTRHHAGANLSAALQDAHDGGLVLCASSGNPALAFADVH